MQHEFKMFIQREMRQRGMSVRDFGAYVGVAHTTISRALDYEAPQPSLSFLVKLARATGTDVCHLVNMVVPSDEEAIDSEVYRLLRRIRRLSEQDRQIILVELQDSLTDL